jgi:hypothetical protein
MKRFLLLIAFVFISSSSFSEVHEYYFKFQLNDLSLINNLTKIISIDNVKGNEVYAYANDDELAAFSKLNIPYEMLPKPSELYPVQMTDDPQQVLAWDYYPTYNAYITMMNQFASQHPSLCKIVNAGTTVQGRSILFAVISDNVATHEAEPQFQYSSSMHGDELTGYVLMLRMINHLLTNYGTDPKITTMVNNMEIWINPLGNPDGTYHNGDTTVIGATRYNANGKDLNRNFPDPQDGPYPTGAWQPETIVYMNLFSANHFVMSANFHGGAEVFNYPWDTWARLHADDTWWIRIGRQYADTVHVNAVAGYMDDLNNGITNGYAWYRVAGGRQDYMTYFKHGREVTIELSNTKLLPPANLPAHWNYNYKSMLNYMQQAMYGVTGTVKDSVTLLPLKAMVFTNSHDIDSAEVYSDSTFGKYYRVILQGTYSITYSSPGHYSKTVNNIYVKNDSTTTVNVLLRPFPVSVSNNGTEIPSQYSLGQNYPNPFNPSTTINVSIPSESEVTLKIYDISGRETACLIDGKMKAGNYKYNFNASSLSSGIYFYKLSSNGFSDTKKMILVK